MVLLKKNQQTKEKVHSCQLIPSSAKVCIPKKPMWSLLLCFFQLFIIKLHAFQNVVVTLPPTDQSNLLTFKKQSFSSQFFSFDILAFETAIFSLSLTLTENELCQLCSVITPLLWAQCCILSPCQTLNARP